MLKAVTTAAMSYVFAQDMSNSPPFPARTSEQCPCNKRVSCLQ